jgi:hypothetical protein
MKMLPILAFVFATLAASGVGASPDPTLVEAERMSNTLRQGMALEDVRKLLGNPVRTTLRTDGDSSSEATRSTLQWIYTWTGTAGTGTLRVDFGSKTPEAWKVKSWAWASY